MALADNENTTVMTKIENMTGKVDKKIAYYIRSSIKTLFCCIDHYFHCSGCMECNKEVRNRDLLQDYKAQFEHEILRFQKALEEEMSQSTRNLVVELSSHQDSIKMDDILKKKGKEVISKSKSTTLSTVDKEKIFDEMWKTETEEIIGKVTLKHMSKTDIQTTVQNAIRTCLGPDYFRYIRKKISKSGTFDDLGFIVKQQHADGGAKLAPHALRQLRKSTEAIVDNTFVHYSRLEKGREFEQKHAEILFKDIQKEIDRIKDEGIETTLDYRVDLMMYIEESAVMNFCLNQKAYEENRNLRGLLDRKKDAYHDVFLIATGLGNPVKDFANIILKITEENMEDRMTRTGLLNILRNHHGDTFRSAQALTTSSIIGPAQHTFRQHRLSIENYEKKIKDTIRDKSVACLTEKNRLKKYAKSKLNTIIEDLKDAVVKTVRSDCESEDFIGTLFFNMKGLKKPHNDIEAYKMITVDNKDQFATTLISQLTDSIHEKLKNDIDDWDVARKVEEKGLTKFVFKEIIGCLYCKMQHDKFLQNGTYGRRKYQILSEDNTCSNEEGEKQLRTHNCNGGVGSGNESFVKIYFEEADDEEESEEEEDDEENQEDEEDEDMENVNEEESEDNDVEDEEGEDMESEDNEEEDEEDEDMEDEECEEDEDDNEDEEDEEDNENEEDEEDDEEEGLKYDE